MTYYQPRNHSIKTNGIVGLLFFLLVLVALYYLAKGVFTLLMWLTPVLLIAALIIDYRSVVGFVKWIGSLFQRNAILGIVVALLAVVLYPLTSGFLFVKALASKKIRSVKEDIVRRREGEFVQHEEMSSRPSRLDLNAPRPERRRVDNRTEEADFEELFD